MGCLVCSVRSVTTKTPKVTEPFLACLVSSARTETTETAEPSRDYPKPWFTCKSHGVPPRSGIIYSLEVEEVLNDDTDPITNIRKE